MIQLFTSVVLEVPPRLQKLTRLSHPRHLQFLWSQFRSRGSFAHQANNGNATSSNDNDCDDDKIGDVYMSFIKNCFVEQFYDITIIIALLLPRQPLLTGSPLWPKRTFASVIYVQNVQIFRSVMRYNV